MRIQTRIQWVEPSGTWHQPGEITELDEKSIENFDDLLAEGTVIAISTLVENEPKPESDKPAKQHKIGG